jgi:hypothetical protein
MDDYHISKLQASFWQERLYILSYQPLKTDANLEVRNPPNGTSKKKKYSAIKSKHSWGLPWVDLFL